MIRRELAVFLVVGTLTVVVDFLAYRGLIGAGLLPLDWAKGAGFLSGTVFAYFANRFWTFSHQDHSPGSAWRFAGLYATTLGANVLINSLMLGLLGGAGAAIQLAFLVATGVSAALNFVGMKLFVFKAAGQPEFP